MARKLSRITQVLIASGIALFFLPSSFVHAESDEQIETYKRYHPAPEPKPPAAQTETQSSESSTEAPNPTPSDSHVPAQAAESEPSDEGQAGDDENAEQEEGKEGKEEGFLDKSFKPLITPELKSDVNQQVSDQLQSLREETKKQVGNLENQFRDKLPDLIKKIPIDEEYQNVINENLNKWLPGLSDKANQLIDPAAAAITQEVTVRVGAELDSIPVEPWQYTK